MTQPASMDEIAAARDRLEQIRREVMRVYVGHPRIIDLLLTTLLAQGHALL